MIGAVPPVEQNEIFCFGRNNVAIVPMIGACGACGACVSVSSPPLDTLAIWDSGHSLTHVKRPSSSASDFHVHICNALLQRTVYYSELKGSVDPDFLVYSLSLKDLIRNCLSKCGSKKCSVQTRVKWTILDNTLGDTIFRAMYTLANTHTCISPGNHCPFLWYVGRE